MGVKISEILSKQEIDAESLSGKTIAVDALNTLYQFLSIIRQPDGTPLKDSKGNVTSHLSGIFYRNINLMHAGVKLVYVFDGKPPEFKNRTAEARRKVRDEAHAKWQEALEKGDIDAARKSAQASVRITDEIISESKELLSAMGIPIVQAPSEGEAQAAFMAKRGDVYACASSDMDSLLFGAQRLVRNLNITGKRKIPGTNIYRDIVPEMIELGKVLSELEISREQLVILGILIGTDFNPGGIKGIGPKTALKIAREHKDVESAFENIEWNFDVSPKQIFDFFMNPPVSEKYSLEQGKMDEGKIREILHDRHEFSSERVDKMLEKAHAIEAKKKQKTLGSWG